MKSKWHLQSCRKVNYPMILWQKELITIVLEEYSGFYLYKHYYLNIITKVIDLKFSDVFKVLIQ